MKKVIFAIATVIALTGVAHADADRDSFFALSVPTIATIVQPSPAAWAAGGVIAMVTAGNTYYEGCPKELYESPNLLVKRPGESYNFEVSACDYEAKKDRLIIVK